MLVLGPDRTLPGAKVVLPLDTDEDDTPDTFETVLHPLSLTVVSHRDGENLAVRGTGNKDDSGNDVLVVVVEKEGLAGDVVAHRSIMGDGPASAQPQISKCGTEKKENPTRKILDRPKKCGTINRFSARG